MMSQDIDPRFKNADFAMQQLAAGSPMKPATLQSALNHIRNLGEELHMQLSNIEGHLGCALPPTNAANGTIEHKPTPGMMNDAVQIQRMLADLLSRVGNVAANLA